ncbi:hypothetical protein RHSIM_Rhsim01G0053800 [Rhododendron simsii]|uniref:Uncharacterized protein n=1 Tax=Rhododendron simsii TaxID=118357 RepID=A0A834M190_RHOSS|nr:hypothetical protein RHSIM_Rhsim01G0053800 [Rhododendron simsii]
MTGDQTGERVRGRSGRREGRGGENIIAEAIDFPAHSAGFHSFEKRIEKQKNMGSGEEVRNVLDILQKYCKASGQLLNFSNSICFFSENTPITERNRLRQIMGIRRDINLGSYLGLPTEIGGSMYNVFSFLKDRLRIILEGWNENFLNQTGKEVAAAEGRTLSSTQNSQAKYSFLTARAGSNPSWTWRSILEGRNVINVGLRAERGIRTGDRVVIDRDQWLPKYEPTAPASVKEEGRGRKV